MYELIFSTNGKAMEIFGRKQAYSYFSDRNVMIQTPLNCNEFQNCNRKDLIFTTNCSGRRLIISNLVTDRLEYGFRVIQTSKFTYVFAVN